MWLLIVMMFSVPPGVNNTKGSISVIVETREECYQIKDRIEKTMRFDNYRISGSCVFKGI
jgi:hypothetical protein